MRVFKNKWFVRWAAKEGISDDDLCKAASQVSKGLVDAFLGGGVVKQRIARDGEGSSGGFRSILLYRKNERIFFVYGFPKKDRENITRDELKAFKELAKPTLTMSDEDTDKALKAGILTEVMCDEQA